MNFEQYLADKKNNKWLNQAVQAAQPEQPAVNSGAAMDVATGVANMSSGRPSTMNQQYAGVQPQQPQQQSLPEFVKPNAVGTGGDKNAAGVQQQPISYVDFVMKNYRQPDVTDDIEQTKRDRRMHLFGNVATVLGQGLGSLMGARKFDAIKSNDNYYQQRLDQLRDAQRKYATDYNSSLLNAAYNDFKLKQAELQNQRYLDRIEAQKNAGIERDNNRSKNTKAEIEKRGEIKAGQMQQQQENKLAQMDKQIANNMKLAHYKAYAQQALQKMKDAAKANGSNIKTHSVDIGGEKITFPENLYNDKVFVNALWAELPPEAKYQTFPNGSIGWLDDNGTSIDTKWEKILEEAKTNQDIRDLLKTAEYNGTPMGGAKPSGNSGDTASWVNGGSSNGDTASWVKK